MVVRTATKAPVRKITAGALAGAISIVLLFVLNTTILSTHPIPPEVASAITVILTFIVGYIIPPSPNDGVKPA
jgi:hypothetical protein